MATLPKNDVSFDYAFDAPSVDFRENPGLMPPGSFSRLAGVDGRFKGRLRRFPGFRRYVAIPKTIGGDTFSYIGRSNGGFVFFKGFALQKDSESAYLLRGFLFLASVDGAHDDLYAYYYKTETAAWETKKLLTIPGSAIIAIDATWDHRHIYVTGETVGATAFAYILRYDGTNWQSDNLIPSAAPAYTADPSAASEGGQLRVTRGSTAVAYRIVYPAHDKYEQLSAIKTVQAPAAGDAFYVTATISLPANTWAKSRYIEFYRTVQSGYNNTEQIGRLYLERIVDVGLASNSSLTLDWGKTTTGLSDDALVQQDTLDPQETKVVTTLPNQPHHIEYYEDTVFTSTGPGSVTQGTDLEVLRWSALTLKRPNLFPVEYRRRLPDLSVRVKDIVPVGPFLAVIYDSGLLRLHKSGFKLSIDTIHNRFGSTSRLGSVAVGSNLYMVSSVGVLICDMLSGQLEVFPTTQHLFDDGNRWKSDLANIQAAFDSVLGTLWFWNPTQKEGLILWLNEGTLTELHDGPFAAVTTTAPPVEGGLPRAFFLHDQLANNTFDVYVVDETLAAETRSMRGGVATDSVTGKTVAWNDTVATGSATNTVKITGTTRVFHADMVGFYIRFLSGTNKGQRRKVLSVDSTTQITLDSVLGTAPASGDLFAIAAIPFLVTLWPTSPTLFDVDKVNAGVALVTELSGDTGSGNPNMTLTYQVFRPTNMTTAANDAAGTLSTVPKTTAAGLAYAHNLIVPGVEQWASNVQFDLTGLRFAGTIERSIVTS